MLESIASADLLTALASNMVAFWSPYGRAGRCVYQESDGITWFYTGIQHTLFNGVLSIELTPDNVKSAFDRLQAQIKEQGVPALWWVGPQAPSLEMESLLNGYGLQPIGESPGMAADLDQIESEPETLANFTIRQVTDTETQTLWARVAAIGSEFSEEAVEGMARVEATLSEPAYRAQHRYIGFLDDIPVGTSALVLDSGVAGIYAVATIPESRRQGIGKLMTVLPLIDARQLGYRVGTLQSSDMGRPIYQQIGFRDVCRFRLYLQS